MFQRGRQEFREFRGHDTGVTVCRCAASINTPRKQDRAGTRHAGVERNMDALRPARALSRSAGT